MVKKLKLEEQVPKGVCEYKLCEILTTNANNLLVFVGVSKTMICSLNLKNGFHVLSVERTVCSANSSIIFGR